jgi:GcrA cell cycle regulator
MPAPGAMKWTAEQDAALKAHVERNEMSYAKICDEINAQFNSHYTRNATIGRAKRIGLCNPALKSKRANQYKTEYEHQYRPRKRWNAPALPPVKIANVIPLRSANVAPRNVRILELGPCDCRYPVDNVSPFFFCGLPTHVYNRDGAKFESAYCRLHFQLTRRAS